MLLTIWAVVCLALAGWMGWEFYIASAALSWPATEGVVRKSRLMEIVKTSGNRQYRMEVTYEYTVGGQTYTNDTFNSRGNYIDSEQVPDLPRQYVTGTRCQVFYNPSSPGQCVLVPGRTWHAWGKLVIGLVALVGAVFCIVVVFHDLTGRR